METLDEYFEDGGFDGDGRFNGSCIRNGRFEGFADDVDFV